MKNNNRAEVVDTVWKDVSSVRGGESSSCKMTAGKFAFKEMAIGCFFIEALKLYDDYRHLMF